MVSSSGQGLISAALMGVLLLLSGCRAVGPNYTPPTPPVPDLWSQAVKKELSESQPALEEWWTQFNDPLLSNLIERCRETNLTLKQTLSRVREARLRRAILSRNLQPNIDVSAGYTRTKPSARIPPLSQVPEELLNADAVNIFSFGFDMAWELDIFGGVRRSIEAAAAGADASLEGYRDVLVTLLAEVGRSYVELRTLQARIEYAEANIERQRETLTLVESRFAAGLVGRLDVEQARSNLANTESLLPQLRLGLRIALNQLTFLLSLPPGQLSAQLEPQLAIPDPPSSISVGVPANLLRRRPDIRRAERTLAASTAQIGVSKANLYPRFGLVGDLFGQSVDLGDLSGAGTWSITPFLKWNVFNRGRLKDLVRATEEQTEQALLSYENAVLFALAEVESALAAFLEGKNTRDDLSRAVAATEEAVELVNVLYNTGLTDFQNVLDTERFLASQQDRLAASEGQVGQSAIALYKALGGGWSPSQPLPAGAPRTP